jgi:hypothetical protein
MKLLSKIHHPFEYISPSIYLAILLTFFTITVIVSIFLSMLDPSGLQNASSRNYDIVSFELAGNFSNVSTMLDAWGESGKVRAALSLGLDFLFIPLYTSTIGLACIWIALYSGVVFLAPLGSLLAWLQLIGGGLDITENVALIRILLGDHQGFLPSLAKYCAISKFSIVILGFIYIVFGFIAWLILTIKR